MTTATMTRLVELNTIELPGISVGVDQMTTFASRMLKNGSGMGQFLVPGGIVDLRVLEKKMRLNTKDSNRTQLLQVKELDSRQ